MISETWYKDVAAHAVRRRVRCLLHPHVAADSRALLRRGVFAQINTNLWLRAVLCMCRFDGGRGAALPKRARPSSLVCEPHSHSPRPAQRASKWSVARKSDPQQCLTAHPSVNFRHPTVNLQHLATNHATAISLAPRRLFAAWRLSEPRPTHCAQAGAGSQANAPRPAPRPGHGRP
jgi:hypothetical protein